jgi:hypothetical protein
LLYVKARQAHEFEPVWQSDGGTKAPPLTFLSVIFLLAIFTSVNLFFRVGEDENVFELLLDRCDTSWIFAFYHVCD